MSKTMEVIFILDRSGSMHGQEEDIIGGFNEMLESQRKNGYEALVTVVLFDRRFHILRHREPIAQVKDLTDRDYRVGGSTALLDTMGYVMEHFWDKQREERPDKTLAVIMTDGVENASTRFNSEQIRDMVTELETEYNWEFLFIGADIDAISAAANVGVRKSKAYSFSKKTDSFRGGLNAVGNIMFCISEQDEKLTDDDWNILQRVFDRKKKK